MNFSNYSNDSFNIRSFQLTASNSAPNYKMICNQLLNHKTNSYSQMSTFPICKHLKKLVDMLIFF